MENKDYVDLGTREFKTCVNSEITKVKMFAEVLDGLPFYSCRVDNEVYHVAIDNSHRFTFYKDGKLYWSLV